MLATFETAGKTHSTATIPARYAVRQVLHQEFQLFRARREAAARQARFAVGGPGKLDVDDGGDKENVLARGAAGAGVGKEGRPRAVKRDFFGRVIANEERVGEAAGGATSMAAGPKGGDAGRTWVSYHEGFSNAVRKPITLAELMSGL